jgi:glycosyltransferase involved in cell wall biosynthesis
VDVVLEAARRVPEADVLVTGRAPAGLEARLPGNVRLTGFLTDEAYSSLLRSAGVIVALTLRQGTLLYGAQEAMALHKPLIVSKTSTLEAYFGGGPLFSENEPEALAALLRQALARGPELEARMAEFHARYLAEGEARLRGLVARLGS